MRRIKKLPKDAKYVWEDIFGHKYYLGRRRTYIAWEESDKKYINSYKKDEL